MHSEALGALIKHLLLNPNEMKAPLPPPKKPIESKGSCPNIPVNGAAKAAATASSAEKAEPAVPKVPAKAVSKFSDGAEVSDLD